ncbi:hypothetical protein [Methylobacterium sp. NEAU K]|uniref:hypothetical protein n=1 Tax=Methylobacterium sp. NEAU K TaxID=3064946 RepID=UPI0027355A6F|nr:hypothetical protein [Methylobacterium sp. NEAU K]MDP4006361.1 hypothetical protein [Methylobacterium sp. NEAU K]
MAEHKPFHPDVNDFRTFNEAQHQVHSLLQWVARVENSYGPDAGTRGSVRLRWCDKRRAIKTHGFADGLELELRVGEMVLQFLEDGRPSNHAFSAEEHSPAHAEAWLLIELLHRGVDRSKFTKSLPYDASQLLSGDGQEFNPAQYQKELTLLAEWMSHAAHALRSADQGQGSATDNRILVRPEDLSMELDCSKYVVGFKPVGSVLDEPYFYVRGRDSQERQSEDFVAASHIFRNAEGTPLEEFVRGH